MADNQEAYGIPYYWSPTPAIDLLVKESIIRVLGGTPKDYVVAHNKRIMSEKKHGGIYRGYRAKVETFDEW